MTPCNTSEQDNEEHISSMASRLTARPQAPVDWDESDVQNSHQNQLRGPLQMQSNAENAASKPSPKSSNNGREQETVSETIKSTVRSQANAIAGSSNNPGLYPSSVTYRAPQGEKLPAQEAFHQKPFVIAVPLSAVSPKQSEKASSTPAGNVTSAPAPPSSGGATVVAKPLTSVAKLSDAPKPSTPPIDSTPRTIAYSSSSTALSSTGEDDVGKEENSDQEQNSDQSSAVAAEQSGKSGVTPPMETTSISSDQVPTTVEVPAQPKLTMARPSSTPHSLSKMHVELPQSISVGVMHPIPSHVQSSAATAQKSKASNSLRRGKWTVEEEAYVARVIQDFNSGYLNAPAGTTLRSYLSEKLHCDPMRITKKFTGDACIGKRVFHPAVRCPSNTAAIDKAQAELDALERRWRRRLEMQQRESAKKAAASAAAAAAAASGRSHFHSSPGQPPVAGTQPPGNPQHFQQKLVTRTASWLDRANAILSTGQSGAVQQPANPQHSLADGSLDHAQAVRSLPAKEFEDQMREVQRLIHEGPIIQQTTAGLPHLLDQTPSGADSPSLPPADKRARRLSGDAETSGAADAEALVGFLNSVRAAAAAGQSN